MFNDVWSNFEANFTLHDYINSKDKDNENAHRVSERPLYSKKCTTRSFSFEDDLCNKVTVTKQHYVPEFEQFWEELKELENFIEEEQWFQNDDAPTHTANFSMAMLHEHFEECLINNKAEVEWEPQISSLGFSHGEHLSG